ncbi:hypothetical protein AAG906_018812 [Vitis piasezkii]
MNGVECVGDEFYGNASFQFLETLSFEDMQNWEKWLCCGEFLVSKSFYTKVASNLKSLDSGGLQQLTSLLQLKIFCPELQFSTGSVLQHLISKTIRNKWMLEAQSLTEVGLQHLTSLESLWIGNCPMLQSLTKVGLQHLTSLKTLVISNCRKLKYLTKRDFRLLSLFWIHVFIVSNQDEHRRFVMINKVSIMTMEETCKVNNNNFMPICLNSPLVQQLAMIGPIKMDCSDFPVEEGRFLGAQHFMLIALFKKTKKLRGTRFISYNYL